MGCIQLLRCQSPDLTDERAELIAGRSRPTRVDTRLRCLQLVDEAVRLILGQRPFTHQLPNGHDEIVEVDVAVAIKVSSVKHHIYANDPAMEGYKSGKFPDGAVIVFDLLEVSRGDNAIAEGPRKIVGVMQRDGSRFAGTGGWGFEGFVAGDPSQRAVGDQARGACFACHLDQARQTGYVFSTWRE